MFRTILKNLQLAWLLLVGLFHLVAAPRSTRASRLSNNRSRHSISIAQFKRTILLGLTLFAAGMVNVTFAQSSVFTYQGRLQDGGVAANGSYDFRFTLWDASSGGAQQPQTAPVTVNLANVQVTAGNFSVQLDFGATAFPGADRYLEMSVQLAGTGPFTTLAPRTKVTGTPYAIRSVSAANADTVADGSISSAKILDGTIVNGDINAAAGIVDTKLATISTALKVSNSATTATSANTANAIVARDASGNFSAGTITGNLTGNASTATTAGNVTGVVAIANGGTGSATQNFVDLSSTQASIGGAKTFTNPVNTTGDGFSIGGTRVLSKAGVNNLFVGAGAGGSNTTGSSNTAGGFQALQNNTTGSNNIGLGQGAGGNLTTGSNNINIGNGGVAGESNIIRIGIGQTDTFLTGIIHGDGSGLNNLPAGTVADGSITSAKLASNLTLGGATTGTFSGTLTGNASTATTAGNVTGVVAIANGGTGSATQNFVDLSSTQSIDGPKTFTSPVDTTGDGFSIGGTRVLSKAGANNLFVGEGAGAVSTTGSFNTASGWHALFSNTTGSDNTASGGGALRQNTTAGNNTASGAGALENNTTGNANTASGAFALFANTTGGNNMASGYKALLSNTTGVDNTASGTSALQNNTTGFENTANGIQALGLNTTGSSNTAGGAFALSSNTTGAVNTAIGRSALGGNTTGIQNTASGAFALQNNTTGVNNTANGQAALISNTTGDANTASGLNALQNNTTGSNNIGLGYLAGINLTTGSNNIDIGNGGVAGETGIIRIGIGQTDTFLTGIIHGDGSGLTNLPAVASFTGTLVGDVTGAQGATVVSTVGAVTAANVASGANLANAATDANTVSTIVRRDASGSFSAGTITAVGDMNLSTTNAAGTVGVINQNGSRLIHSFGTNNFFAGTGAGNFTMTGGANTASGAQALLANTTGFNNTASGAFALQNNTAGANNTASGVGALQNNTGVGNTASGVNALLHNAGNFNTASGVNALFSNTGVNNTASGVQALQNNTTGGDNTASGTSSLQFNTTGGGNTASGTNALINNTTGNNNIGLGEFAGGSLTTGSDNIDIGNSGLAGESGVIRIGTTGNQTKAFIAGINGVTTGGGAVQVLIDGSGQLGTTLSSRRYKQDIKDMGSTSSRLMSLRPVTFRYLKPYANGEKPIQFGLIAEEVAEIFPELVVRNKEGLPETVKYQDLTPLLLNEVQKQAKTIAALQAQATSVANGNTTTNKQGEAIVTLPDNFVATNQDFRYQLTVVGQFAQAIVLQEVKGHQFKIKTDKPNVKVSWQVTGIRPGQSAGKK